MGLFSAKKKNDAGTAPIVETAENRKNTHPFLGLYSYSPYCAKQLQLYSQLREAVPVIDAAISKLVRLIGTFDIKCNDKLSQKEIDDFCDNVVLNGGVQGIEQFMYMYFDRLLTYGTAVGEIVMKKDRSGVFGLYNASLEDISLCKGDSPFSVDISVKNSDGSLSKVKNPQFMLVSMLNPNEKDVFGTSVLKGLPFVSSVLLKIFNTIGVNFERIGNVRFAVTYKPSDNSGINSKQRVKEIASQWSKAMRDSSSVCDFVSVGDVSVKVIGADNQVLSCDIEIRHLLEQIVSKLSIPPFLLGLSWSSTERMSSQQADILTSELDYYRTVLEPVIRKICKFHLRACGLSDEFEICWNTINLQDETELAKARLDNARAMQIEKEISEVKE